MKRLPLLLGTLFVAGCLLSCDPMLFDTFERVTKIATLEPVKEADSVVLRAQFIDVSAHDAGRPYGFYYIVLDAGGTVLSEDTTIVDSIKVGEVSAGFEYRHKLKIPLGGRIECAAAIDRGNGLQVGEVQIYEVQPDKTPALYIQSVSNITDNNAHIIAVVERPPVDGKDIAAIGLEVTPAGGSTASFEDPVSAQGVSYPITLEDDYTALQAIHALPALVPATEYTLALFVRMSDNSVYRSAEVRFRTLP